MLGALRLKKPAHIGWVNFYFLFILPHPPGEGFWVLISWREEQQSLVVGAPLCSCSGPAWCCLPGLELNLHEVLNVPCVETGAGIAAACPVSGFICCSQLWVLGCSTVGTAQLVCIRCKNVSEKPLRRQSSLSGRGFCILIPRCCFWRALPKSSQVNNKLPCCLQQVQSCGGVGRKNRVECWLWEEKEGKGDVRFKTQVGFGRLYCSRCSAVETWLYCL